MTTISLRLSPEETELIKGYAKFYNISVSEFIRQTILKKSKMNTTLKRQPRLIATT